MLKKKKDSTFFGRPPLNVSSDTEDGASRMYETYMISPWMLLRSMATIFAWRNRNSDRVLEMLLRHKTRRKEEPQTYKWEKTNIC